MTEKQDQAGPSSSNEPASNIHIDLKDIKGSSTVDDSLFSEEAITTSLNELFKKGDVIELRILNAGKDKEETYYGYYNDFAKLSKDAQKYDKKAYVYVTLNPVKEEFLGKANNRLVKSKTSTPDSGILKRTHFGIDFDIHREGLSGISSNESEHKLALGAADMVRRGLSEKFGWPEPIVADSGNGAHLVYDIDLPNDAESAELLHQCLEYLQWFYGTKHIDIDQKVFNASRIWKLYGTTACKGDPTPERPHRVSKILSIPKERKIVTADQLIELAVQRPFEADKETEIKDQPRSDKFDIEGWMNKVGIAFKPGRSGSENGIIYDLPSCPFGGHDGSMIAQRSNGALVFKCQHSSCGDNDWKKLRALKEPARRKHYDKDEDEDYEVPASESVETLEDIPIPTEDIVPPISFDGLPDYNWIKQFVDYISTISSTYKEYSFQNGIAILSAITRRRIYFRIYGAETYTNLWTLNLGQSGYSHKTASYTVSERILRKSGVDVLLPSDITPEGLIDEIADRVESRSVVRGEEIVKSWEREQEGIRSALKSLWKDEAGEFYAKCNKQYMASMKEFLCNLYDCPDFKEKKLSQKRFSVDQIYFGMNLSTTPQSFYQTLMNGDVHTGFLTRHNIVSPTYDQEWKDGKEESDSDIEIEDNLAKLITDIDSLLPEVPLRVQMDESCLKVWNAWSRERQEYFRKTGNDAMGSFFSRFQTTILKMAILIELGNVPYNLIRYLESHPEIESTLPESFCVDVENETKKDASQPSADSEKSENRNNEKSTLSHEELEKISHKPLDSENGKSMSDFHERSSDHKSQKDQSQTRGFSVSDNEKPSRRMKDLSLCNNTIISNYYISHLPISINSLRYAINLHDCIYLPYTSKILTHIDIGKFATHLSNVEKVVKVLKEKKVLFQRDLMRASHLEMKEFHKASTAMLLSGTAKCYSVKGKTRPGIAWAYVPEEIPKFNFNHCDEDKIQPDLTIKFSRKHGKATDEVKFHSSSNTSQTADETKQKTTGIWETD